MDGDILTDVLRAEHMSGAIFFDVHATSPWVSEAPHSREIRALVMPEAQHLLEYHVLVSGSCWSALVDGSAPVELGPGSILIFPHGDPHTLSSAPNMRAQPDLSTFAAATPENPRPFYLDPGGDGPETARIICGFLGCDAGPFNPLLRALPPLLHVADGANAEDGWLGRLIDATVRESEARRLGSGGVLSKLAELIFIEAIRRHAEAQPDAARNWLVGLRDPQVGRALGAIHADPRRAWTLPELAREAGAALLRRAAAYAKPCPAIGGGTSGVRACVVLSPGAPRAALFCPTLRPPEACRHWRRASGEGPWEAAEGSAAARKRRRRRPGRTRSRRRRDQARTRGARRRACRPPSSRRAIAASGCACP